MIKKYYRYGTYPTVDLVFPLFFTDVPMKEDLKVLHMTNVEGEIESLDWTQEADGIHVKVNKFSPFAIIYDPSKVQLVAAHGSVSLPRTGDSSIPVLWAALLLGSAAGWFVLLRRRRLWCRK